MRERSPGIWEVRVVVGFDAALAGERVLGADGRIGLDVRRGHTRGVGDDAMGAAGGLSWQHPVAKPVRLAVRPVEQPAEEPDGGHALERRKGDRTSLTPRL